MKSAPAACYNIRKVASSCDLQAWSCRITQTLEKANDIAGHNGNGCMKITKHRGGLSTGKTIHPASWLLVFTATVGSILLILSYSILPDRPDAAGAVKVRAAVPPDPAQETEAKDSIQPASEPEATPAPSSNSWDILQRFQLNRTWTGDLNEFRKRRLIRALVVYSRTMYFLDGARERGATYEFLKRFEDSINKKYRTGNLPIHIVFIPVNRDELLRGLLEGRGDIAAANLTITEARRKMVDFSEPIESDVKEIIVTGPAAPGISRLEDLAGQEVYVRKSSSYDEHLQSLNESFRSRGLPEIRIRPVNEDVESEDILEMVNAGLFPVTVIDDHVAEVWRQIYPGIRVRSDLVVHSAGQIAWAFRRNSPQLMSVANEFIRSNKKGTLFGNILAKKYFGDVTYIKNNTGSEDLKRYRATAGYFRKYAAQYGFDSLMMSAQGYQESGLDQTRVSHSGAIGIMQMKPSTAADRNVNIRDINRAESNIHAGIKYMRFMMDYYFRDERMDGLNKGLFAVASYNAGPNRVAGLRKKAQNMGLNPNVWFRNVEVVAAREIGRETVQYVSNVFKYYLAYKTLEAKEIVRSEAAPDGNPTSR